MSIHLQPPKDPQPAGLTKKSSHSSTKRTKKDFRACFDIQIFSPDRQRSRSLPDEEVSPKSTRTATNNPTRPTLTVSPLPASRANNPPDAESREGEFQAVLSMACDVAFENLQRHSQRYSKVLVVDLDRVLRESLFRKSIQLEPGQFLEWLDYTANHLRDVSEFIHGFVIVDICRDEDSEDGDVKDGDIKDNKDDESENAE